MLFGDRLNSDGTIKRIYMNNHDRSAFIDAPPEKMLSIYKAYATFFDIANTPEYVFELKMSNGKFGICKI